MLEKVAMDGLFCCLGQSGVSSAGSLRALFGEMEVDKFHLMRGWVISIFFLVYSAYRMNQHYSFVTNAFI